MHAISIDLNTVHIIFYAFLPAAAPGYFLSRIRLKLNKITKCRKTFNGAGLLHV